MQGQDYLPGILNINTNCADIVSGIVSDLCKMNFKEQINREHHIIKGFQIVFISLYAFSNCISKRI